MLLRRFVSTSLAASIALVAATSSANGRYPSAGQIVLDPSEPAHLVVRATYGILTTRDTGATWNWICEGAVGYGGFEDPMMAITGDGRLLAGIFEGLSTSTDGCAWGFAPGPLKDRYVLDLALEKDGMSGVLVVSNSIGASQFSTQLYGTKDAGATWAQKGVDLPPEFLGLTVEIAPSDASRFYVSGRYGKPDYQGSIERTKDGGATWERLDIKGSDSTHLPYIAAVDPNNADILYVRTDGEPVDELLVSKDGGQTFTSVFQSKGNLLGFALSPDGKTVYLGGDADGLWSADTTSLQFKQVSKVGVKCLLAKDSDLYACADEFVDKFTAGKSKDGGKTFEAIMHLQALCGPLECSAQSSVGATCPALWGATKQTIQAQDCGATTSSSSSSSSGGRTVGSTTGGTPATSSGCALSTGQGTGLLTALTLACAALALTRRRR
jgi:hypothetical protein